MNWGTCFHEAGHICAAHLLKLTTTGATVRPNASEAGSWSYGSFSPQQAPAAIAAALCGFVAERSFNPDTGIAGARHDVEWAHVVFKYDLSEREPDEAGYFAQKWREAEALVIDNWGMICDLAVALLQNETLSADQIAQVIQESISRTGTAGAGQTTNRATSVH